MILEIKILIKKDKEMLELKSSLRHNFFLSSEKKEEHKIIFKNIRGINQNILNFH